MRTPDLTGGGIFRGVLPYPCIAHLLGNLVCWKKSHKMLCYGESTCKCRGHRGDGGTMGM